MQLHIIQQEHIIHAYKQTSIKNSQEKLKTEESSFPYLRLSTKSKQTLTV